MKIIEKDITTIPGGIILNGVNCQDVMGSGVAKALFTKWPKVKEQYHAIGKENMHLGLVDFVQVEENTIVANCWTQEFYGSNGKRYASVDAVRECATKVFEQFGGKIYTPQIGCGLGGLSWEKEIEPLFLELEIKYNTVDLTVCVI